MRKRIQHVPAKPKRIIAFIIDHDVVDAILKHLAKAETPSPRGPPGTAALSVDS